MNGPLYNLNYLNNLAYIGIAKNSNTSIRCVLKSSKISAESFMSLYRDYIQLSEIVPLSFISDLQNKWRVFIVYCLALITIQFHGPSVYMYI